MTAHEMLAREGMELRCAQCDRVAPTGPELLQEWGNVALLPDTPDELLAKMLLCPGCLRDNLAGDFESGPSD